MRSFNLARTIFPALLGLGLISCTLPDPNNNATTGSPATFTLDSQDGSLISTDMHPTFSIPVAKHFSFKACFKDRKLAKAVKSHKFTVSGGEGNLDLTTDASGCLVWEEKIAYNHLADAAYVEVKRSVTAKGIQKGTLNVSWALNPWQDQVLSMKDKKVDGMLSGDKAKVRLQGIDDTTKKPVSRPLVLENTIASVVPLNMDKSGIQIAINLHSEPKVMVKDINGQDTKWALTAGQFKAKMYLIRQAYYGKDHKREFVAKPFDVSIDQLLDGQISIPATVSIEGGCSLYQYYIGLEVTPVNGPVGLTGFGAIYAFAACENIQNRQFLPVFNDNSELKYNGTPSFSVETYVGKKAPPAVDGNATNSTGTTSTGKAGTATAGSEKGSGADDTSDDSPGLQNSPIQVSEITAQPYYIEQVSETLRKRHFLMNICLTSAIDNRPIRAHSLQVTGSSGTLLKPRSYVDGCMLVEDSYAYNFFSEQCWKKFEVHVQSDDLGIDRRIPVRINAQDSGAFFFDMSNATLLADGGIDWCAPGIPELTATTFTFSKLAYAYTVDPMLNLQVHKNGNLYLKLSFNRPAFSDASGTQDANLAVGNYMLRWAIVDPTLVANDTLDLSKASGLIYSVGEQQVKIRSNSSITEVITFVFSNLKAIGDTNAFVFEISPIDATSSDTPSDLVSDAFWAPINIFNNQESDSIHDLKIKGILPQLVAQFHQDQADTLSFTKAQSSKENFAKISSLTLVNVNQDDPLFKKLDRQIVKSWIENGKIDKSFVDPLCKFWVNEVLTQPIGGKRLLQPLAPVTDPLTSECTDAVGDSPEKYFDLEYRYLVDNPKVTSVDSDYTDLSISQSFSMATGYSFTDSVGFSQDVQAGVRADSGKAESQDRQLQVKGLSRISTPSLGGLSVNASTNGRYSILNLNWTKSSALTNTNTFTKTISANLETINAKIHADDYEKCVVIRTKPLILIESDLTKNLDKRNWFVRVGRKISDILGNINSPTAKALISSSSKADILDLASRGYMICLGEKAHSPRDFDESYYTINQKSSNTQTIDNSAEKSRPFFIQLRGRSELISFMSVAIKSTDVPDTYRDEYFESQLINDPILPAFRRKYGSFPGQIVAPQ